MLYASVRRPEKPGLDRPILPWSRGGGGAPYEGRANGARGTQRVLGEERRARGPERRARAVRARHPGAKNAACVPGCMPNKVVFIAFSLYNLFLFVLSFIITLFLNRYPFLFFSPFITPFSFFLLFSFLFIYFLLFKNFDFISYLFLIYIFFPFPFSFYKNLSLTFRFLFFSSYPLFF